MAYVYRVEHKELIDPQTDHCFGPFRSGWRDDHFDSAASVYTERTETEYDNPMHKPLPHDDGLSHIHKHDKIFGCDSINDILEWFPDRAGRAAMAELGFTLRRYHVERLSRLCR